MGLGAPNLRGTRAVEAGTPLGREAQPEGVPLPHWPRPHCDQCLNTDGLLERSLPWGGQEGVFSAGK